MDDQRYAPPEARVRDVADARDESAVPQPTLKKIRTAWIAARSVDMPTRSIPPMIQAFSGRQVPAILAAFAGLALGSVAGSADAQAGPAVAASATPHALIAGPAPELRSSCTPEPYPKAAATALAQGRSGLAFTIGADGRARDIVIEIPAGETPEAHRLDVAAVHFLQGCRFDAGLADAARVRRMNYVWSLQAIGSDRWNELGPAEPAIVETPPRAVAGSCDWPTWPASTRAKVDANDAVFRVRVDPAGMPTFPELARSSGQPIVDDTVRGKLSTCRFEPARQQGVAVWGRTWLTFPWRGDELRPRFADAGPTDVPPLALASVGTTVLPFAAGCGRPDLSDVLPHKLVHEVVKLRVLFDSSDGRSRAEIVSASPYPAVDARIVQSFSGCSLKDLFGPQAQDTGPRRVDYAYHLE